MGHVSVLGIDVGLVYYWGGSIDWGGGADAKPTYPELLGGSGRQAMGLISQDDVPVYYDASTGKTLYAHVGTNMTNNTVTVRNSKLTRSPARANYTYNALNTDLDGLKHRLTLAPKEKNELLVLEWIADSEQEALEYVEKGGIMIKDEANNEEYELHVLEHGKDAEKQTKANANLTYVSDENDINYKKASLAVTFTDEDMFNREWTITTEEKASVVLYDVEKMPNFSERTSVSLSGDGSQMEVTLRGENPDKYNTVSFVAVPDNDNPLARLAAGIPFVGNRIKTGINALSSEENQDEEAYLLYKAESANGFTDGQKISFELPDTLASGNYKLKVLASDYEGRYHGSVEKTFSHTNKNQPNDVTAISIANGGDYEIDISVEAYDTDFDGYAVTIYDSDGNAADTVKNMMYTADGSPVRYNSDGTIDTSAAKDVKTANLTAGGQYTYEVKGEELEKGLENKIYNADDVTVNEYGEQCIKVVKGLFGGKEYTVGIRTWRQTDKGVIVYSKEKKSDVLKVNEPIETTVTVTADKTAKEVREERETSKGGKVEFSTPTYRSSTLRLTIEATDKITGTWMLDGGEKENTVGEVKEAADRIELLFTDLEEGVHTLEFRGKNINGDSVAETYVFGVDTVGPRLMLETPVNGELHDAGKTRLSVMGITDRDAVIEIKNLTTGQISLSPVKANVDRDGRFTVDALLDKDKIAQTLEISATDKVGNKTVREVTVVSDALGSIEELQIWNGENNITNKNLSDNTAYILTLKAKLKDGSIVSLDNATLIEWQQMAAEGEVQITEQDGTVILRLSDNAQGMVKARFLVSSLGVNSVVASFGDNEDNEQPGEKIPVELTEGNVTVSGDNRLVYGDTLSKLTLNGETAVFTDKASGMAVEGTVEWQIPNALPDAGTTTASWVFKPSEKNKYMETTGTVEIAVDKATPDVIMAPSLEKSEVDYHPSAVLSDIDVNGDGIVKWTLDGTQITVKGTWKWKDENTVPSADKQQYTVIFIPDDSKNYNIAETEAWLTVNKVKPVITELPVGSVIRYGQTAGQSALSGGSAQHSSGEAIGVTGKFTWDINVKDGRPTVDDSGTKDYTVVFVPDDSVNYDTVKTAVKLQVNPRTAEIIWNGTEGRYYNDNRTVTAEVGNKVGDDDVSLTVAGGDKVQVGTHKAEITGLTGADAKNYTLEGAENVIKEYSIMRVPPEIAAESYLNDIQKKVFTYGEIITVKGTVKEGTEENSIMRKLARSVNGVLAGAQNNQVALFNGEKQLTEYVDVNDDGSYTLSYNTDEKGIKIGKDNVLTVKYTGNENSQEGSSDILITLNRREVSAELTGNAEKVYDGTVNVTESHSLGMKLTGILENDEALASADYRYGDKNAGTTSVIAENIVISGEDSEWYRIVTTSDRKDIGTITKKPLIVKAKDDFVTYNMEASAYRIIGEGFAYGDDESVLKGTPEFVCDYVKGSPVTSEGYKIMPGGVTSDNYEITFKPGMLTVRKADQSASFDASLIVIDSKDEKFTNILTTKFVTGKCTYSSSDTNVATVDADGNVTVFKAGTVIITATFAGDENYNETAVSYTLKVKGENEDNGAGEGTIQTGDETNTAVWQIIMILSVLTIAGAVFVFRNKRKVGNDN